MTNFELFILVGSVPILLFCFWLIALARTRKWTRKTLELLWVGTTLTSYSTLVMALMLPNVRQALFSGSLSSWPAGVVIGLPFWLTLCGIFAHRLGQRRFESSEIWVSESERSAAAASSFQIPGRTRPLPQPYSPPLGNQQEKFPPH